MNDDEKTILLADTKPKSQAELSMAVLGAYWFDVAKLPPENPN